MNIYSYTYTRKTETHIITNNHLDTKVKINYMVIIQIVVDVYLCGGLSWLAAGVLSPSTTIDGGRRIIFPLPRGGCQMFLPNLIELSHNNCSL